MQINTKIKFIFVAYQQHNFCQDQKEIHNLFFKFYIYDQISEYLPFQCHATAASVDF